MRKIFSSFVVIAILFALVPRVSLQAQTAEDARIEQLRQQIAELEAQAKQYRSNIAGERAKADSLQREISIIKNQIGSLEAEINLTTKKIDKTGLEIQTLENDIFTTEDEIENQKQTMGRLLVYLDRYQAEPLFATLIKNNNLSDFLRQSQYVSTVNTQLVALVEELQNAKKALEGNKTDLEQKEDELRRLSEEQQDKKSSLASVKSSKDTLLSRTKGQEAQYQKMLTEVQKREAEFFKELRALETKIVAGGLYLVHIKATTIAPRGTKLFQWPEADARLTQGYGMTTYAKRGAYGGAAHNGIDMAGGFGSSIKSIGDGEIVANGFNDGFGNWVAIRHTNSMVSIYGHMSGLSPLKVGSTVKVGDVIGYEGSTGNSTGSHLHLSLYSEFFTYINEKKNQLYFNYFDGSINPLDYL